jgi:phosphoribosyl 1,2-cyclic phosphate phosphodiesterase
LIKITLLGTGGSAGTPQIGGADGHGDWGELDPAEPRNRRTRSSIVIETPEKKFLLVDTGPETRLQLTACGIPRIDAVFFTHGHSDHIAGFDEIRIMNRLLGAPMPVYATEKTMEDLRRRFDYAFKPWAGGGFFRPVLAPQIVAAGDTLDILGLPVQLIGQDHGYIPSLGMRVGKFAYCTDVVRLDETALAALEGLDTLVIDCFTSGPVHPTHANLKQALEWVERLKPKRTILTHMGLNMDYRRLCASLPAGVEPGFDGLVLPSDFP